MDWENVIEAWKTFRDAIAAYEETLSAEMVEAAQDRDPLRMVNLQRQQKRLRQLHALAHRIEKLLHTPAEGLR